MSYQTRKQSIGYILKGALGSEVPAKSIVDIALAAKKIVPNTSDIDNNQTISFVRNIAESLELTEEDEKSFVSEVYWTFDMKTVEEAEYYFRVFNELFPALSD